MLLTDLDMGGYAKLVDRTYLKRLREIVIQAKDEFKYLGSKDLREIKKKKEKILKKIGN